MNLIIHIGWHKTGTTSIQEFLLNNQAPLQEHSKIYYPNEGLLQCAHHELAWSLQEKKTSPWGDLPLTTPKAIIEAAIANARTHNCENIIFSSEEFCTLSKEQIKLLHTITSNTKSTISIVAYIRRQDLIIESSYNMEVKWWGTRLTEDFLTYVKRKTPYIKYNHTLELWADIFGKDQIKVIPYSPEDFLENDIRLDFCSTANITPRGLHFKKERINDSLAPKTLEFLKTINNIPLPQTTHNKIVTRLFKYDNQNNSPKCILFTEEQRIKFMEELNESNMQLEKFTTNLSPLILTSENLPPKNTHNLTMEEFQEIIEFATLGDPH
ncbi:MAG: hypothetical protein R3355_05510 [Pseudomonas sp.]|uniref:hypothetical protein n=1 Tax=Pseudomonas sp. TaxID=306 RepID=UPI00299D05C0|nr:hypothetical protein [Pseudomonas sp.]MDX1722556.1 hypothetical protein [Pseudomonas sp.]